MNKPTDYTITLSANGATPQPLKTHGGDKITWKLNYPPGALVTLTLPTCVAPQDGPITVFPTKAYTVNKGNKPSYPYKWSAPSKGVQSGTIDVS